MYDRIDAAAAAQTGSRESARRRAEALSDSRRDAAGVPLGSTTYYFASREDLLREAFLRYIHALSSDLQARWVPVETQPSPQRVVDLAGVLSELGCDSAADAASAIIHLMRGYEHEQLTRPRAAPRDLRRRLRALLSAYTAGQSVASTTDDADTVAPICESWVIRGATGPQWRWQC